MKYLVWIFMVLILFYTTNLAFAVQENPVYTKARFPDSIKIGEKTKFSVKVTNIGYYFVSDIKPVIEVNPKSVSGFVHVEVNPSVTALWGGYSGMIYGIIYVDKDIPVERIFVSVYFVAKNSNGEQISLVNPENSASIKIERGSPDTDTNSIFDFEKEKPTCSNHDSKVPLYGCSNVVTVKIDSPLKQFRSGTPSQQVSCKDGFELLLKTSNGQPICVKISTKSKLLQIGWAEPSIIVEEGWIDRSNVECENSPWNCSQPIPDDLIDCDKIDELEMEIWHCPAISAPQEFDMLKIEGFTTCEKNHNTYYILKSGHSGSFTYQIFRGIDGNDPPIGSDKIEMAKEPSFLCEYYDDQFSTRKACTPDGVHVDFESDSPTLGFNQTVTVKATISVDESAKNQSFWLGLTPYTCFGGSYERFVTIKSDNHDSQREITILSISPKNVTLPEPKNQTPKTTCNADGICFTPE